MSKPLAIFLGACFLVSSGLISAAAHAGDAAAGKKVFKKCKACHYAAKDKNKTGPHLSWHWGHAPVAAYPSATLAARQQFFSHM